MTSNEFYIKIDDIFLNKKLNQMNKWLQWTLNKTRVFLPICKKLEYKTTRRNKSGKLIPKQGFVSSSRIENELRVLVEILKVTGMV